MVDLIFWFMELLFELALYVTYYFYMAAGWFSSVGSQIQSQGVESMLPEVVQLALGALITYLVVNGLKEVSGWVGKDLSGNATVIAVCVTGIVVFAVNSILATIVQLNPGAISQIDGVLQVLAVILSAIGFKRTEVNITQGIASMVIAAEEARAAEVKIQV